MKNIFKILTLVVIVSCTACSDIDTENPIINMPSSGNTNNGSDDSNTTASIVGTWKDIVQFEGYNFTYQITFNQNNTVVQSFTVPYFNGENGAYSYQTITDNFTYKYDYDFGILSLSDFSCLNGEAVNMDKIDTSAFIITKDGVDILHINSSGFFPYWMTTFSRVK